MKKRLLALLLAGAMSVGLAACGNSGDEGSANTPAGGETTPVTDGTGEPSAEGKTVKVGMVCIGDENDQGYTYNFIRGKEAATEALAAKGIYTGVTMMPLLPLINDTRENVEAIVRRAKDAGASYILPMFGVTLRSGSREHFHATLDREFPGLKARYEACFGNRYECFSPSYRKLDDTFRNLCAKLGLETRMRFYAPTLPEQGSLF